VQKLIESSTDIERQVMPIMAKCIDGMATAAQMIDCKQVRLVCQQVKISRRLINHLVRLSSCKVEIYSCDVIRQELLVNMAQLSTGS